MPTQIDRIRDLCIQYDEHCSKYKKNRSYEQWLKQQLAKELLAHAEHPNKLLRILNEPSKSLDFPEKTKAEILQMNSSSVVSWFFKGFLLLLSAPISLPIVLLWSLRTRKTINFLKADGALFLEQLIPLCQSWNEPPAPIPEKKSNKPISEGILPMPPLYPKETSGTVQEKNALTSAAELSESQLEEDVDLNNMSKLASQLSNIFGPDLIMGQQVTNFKGKSMVIASKPIEKTDNPNELRLSFTCEFLFVDAPHEQCVIRLFKRFPPMPVTSLPAPLLLTDSATSEYTLASYPLIQASKDYCLSFFRHDFTSMMKKALDEPRLGTWIEWADQALALAKTQEQKLTVIEHIVTRICFAQSTMHESLLIGCGVRLQKSMDAALAELPFNYRSLIAEFEKISRLYDTIWSLLEENRNEDAYELFKTVTLSVFIRTVCPELLAMKLQLYAVFSINGESHETVGGVLSAAVQLSQAYSVLSRHNYTFKIMAEYEPAAGAKPYTIYLEKLGSTLHYVIRNVENTADIVGQLDEDELVIYNDKQRYYNLSTEDLVKGYHYENANLIAFLVDKGHAHQQRSPEMITLHQQTIQVLGAMEIKARTAWQQTSMDDIRARGKALDEFIRTQAWQGQIPLVRTDRQVEYYPQKYLPILQFYGVVDPSIRYLDDELSENSSNLSMR